MRLRWRSPPGRSWLVAAALGGLICFAWNGSTVRPERAPWPTRIIAGESLLHGLPSRDISWAMPVASVSEAVLEDHLPRAFSDGVVKSVMAACVLLVFTLGALLHSHACGLVAALGVVIFRLLRYVDAPEHVIFVLSVLLAANLLVWRSRRPDLRRGVALGAAIGFSLLVRSPLFLFPPLFGAYEWIRDRAKSRAGGICSLWPLFALPVLLLLPWVVMNWAVHSRFIPLENARADYNIVSGALGLVPGVSGGRLLRAAQVPSKDGVMVWAVETVARDPVRYLRSVLARLWFFAQLHPLLLLFALISVLLHRRREAHLQLTLLSGYFIGVHCLLSVLPRYFAPVWPLLAVMAASVITFPFDRGSDPKEDRSASALVAVIALPFVLFSLFSLTLAAAYPFRLDATPAGLDRMVASNPKDAWLLSERGRRRLLAGSVEAALEDLTQAHDLSPSKSSELDLAWALAVRNGPDRDMVRRVSLDDSWVSSRGFLLLSLSLARSGEAATARTAFERARSIKLADCRVLRQETAHERRMQEAICRGDNGLGEELWGLLAAWPPAERSKLLSHVEEFPGFDADSLLGFVDEMSRVGATAHSLRLLDRAVAAEQVDRDPLPDWSWVKVAARAARAGEKTIALKALARAGMRGPDAGLKQEIARIYLELLEWKSAGRLLEGLVPRAGGDFELRLLSARAAQGDGAKDAAREALLRAQETATTPAQRHALAMAWQECGDHGRARALIEGLVAEFPRTAGYRVDRAVLMGLDGEHDAAMAALRQVIGEYPDSARAYLSLGGLLESRGRPAEARKFYAEALQRVGGDDALRPIIENAGGREHVLHPQPGQ